MDLKRAMESLMRLGRTDIEHETPLPISLDTKFDKADLRKPIPLPNKVNPTEAPPTIKIPDVAIGANEGITKPQTLAAKKRVGAIPPPLPPGAYKNKLPTDK